MSSLQPDKASVTVELTKTEVGFAIAAVRTIIDSAPSGTPLGILRGLEFKLESSLK